MNVTEAEWARVFSLRCKSKRGERLTDAEQLFCERAFFADPDRYAALTLPVFEATRPVVLATTEKTPSAEDWDRAEQRATRKVPACSKCGDPTHRLNTCPRLGRT